MAQTELPDRSWTFPARIVRVIDADTIEVVLDLGFDMRRKMAIRLAGVNAPETRGEEREHGLRVKERACAWVAQHVAESDSKVWDEGWPFRVRTEKEKRTFTRYVGRVYPLGGALSLNLAVEEWSEEERQAYGKSFRYDPKPEKK